MLDEGAERGASGGQVEAYDEADAAERAAAHRWELSPREIELQKMMTNRQGI